LLGRLCFSFSLRRSFFFTQHLFSFLWLPFYFWYRYVFQIDTALSNLSLEVLPKAFFPFVHRSSGRLHVLRADSGTFCLVRTSPRFLFGLCLAVSAISPLTFVVEVRPSRALSFDALRTGVCVRTPALSLWFFRPGTGLSLSLLTPPPTDQLLLFSLSSSSMVHFALHTPPLAIFRCCPGGREALAVTVYAAAFLEIFSSTSIFSPFGMTGSCPPVFVVGGQNWDTGYVGA